MNRFITDAQDYVDLNQKCIYQNMVSLRWLGTRLDIIAGLVIFFAALFAVLGRDYGISGENAGLSISNAFLLTLFLSYMIRVMADIETHAVSIERIEEYTNKPIEADWITDVVVRCFIKKTT